MTVESLISCPRLLINKLIKALTLKLLLHEKNMMVWIGFIWFSTVSSRQVSWNFLTAWAPHGPCTVQLVCMAVKQSLALWEVQSRNILEGSA
jgi:hypothetical protein